MVSIRASVIIIHKFYLRYTCRSDGGPLVFENGKPTAAQSSQPKIFTIIITAIALYYLRYQLFSVKFMFVSQ